MLATTCTMGWGAWQGRTGWAALAWLSSLPAAQSQYLKTSNDELVVEKYYEVQKAGTKELENLIGEHIGCPSALPTYLRTTTAACYPYLNEKYNPQDGVLLEAEFKPFADIDQYRCTGGALLPAPAQHAAALPPRAPCPRSPTTRLPQCRRAPLRGLPGRPSARPMPAAQLRLLCEHVRYGRVRSLAG